MAEHINGIHHVALRCCGKEAFDRAVTFYREVIGFPIVKQWGEGADSAAMLDSGNGIIEIFANGKTQAKEGVLCHFAFACDDVPAMVEKVKNAGFPIKTDVTDMVLPTVPPCPIQVAFCLGAAGEEIEFFCERNQS